METKVRFQTTLNTISSPSFGVVITGTSPDELVQIGNLKPFKRSAFKGYKVIAYQQEQRKVTDIGVSGLTVLPSTKYAISIGNQTNTAESNYLGWKKISYVSPSVLGINAVERHNMYTSLAYKINNTSGLHVFAGAVYLITTSGAHGVTGSPVGNVVTYAGGSKTALVLNQFNGHSGVAQTTGTTAVLIPLTGGAPANLDAFGSSTINGAPTLGEGMRIIDDAGYYPQSGIRGGESGIFLSGGFSDTAHRLVAQPAIYASGEPAQIAAKKPVFSATRGDLISGEWSFDPNAVISNTAQYNAIIIEVAEDAYTTAQSNTVQQATTYQIIWVDSQSGNYTQFITALNSI